MSAVEAMEIEPKDAQRSRTSRRMQNCDGCILWIDFSKMVESENGQVVEPEGIIERSGDFYVTGGAACS